MAKGKDSWLVSGVTGVLGFLALMDLSQGKPILGLLTLEPTMANSIKSIFDGMGAAIAAILKQGQTDVNNLPPPPPPPPPTSYALEDDFTSPFYFTGDNQVSPNGKWKMKYLSGGKTGAVNGQMETYPSAATVGTSTFSTLVLSTQVFKNFQLDFDMKTIQQLRTGANKWGGIGPNSWETAWIMWRYTDELPRSVHHYYFMLKTNGYEFGKKDNAPGDTSPEKQIFIKTGTNPITAVGTTSPWIHVTIKQIGFHTTILVNGSTIVDMNDPQVFDATKMAQGMIGLYEEDSKAAFDNVKLQALP